MKINLSYYLIQILNVNNIPLFGVIFHQFSFCECTYYKVFFFKCSFMGHVNIYQCFVNKGGKFLEKL